jgi:tetratricopeptide (TPR) repeat protein
MLEEALASCGNALRIGRKLAENDPDSYRPYVAMTLYNLGQLLREQQKWIEARAALEEALAIYRSLAAEPPAEIASDMERIRSILDSMATERLEKPIH